MRPSRTALRRSRPTCRATGSGVPSSTTFPRPCRPSAVPGSSAAAGRLLQRRPGERRPRAYPQGVGCGSDPRDVEGNAFYCRRRDVPNSDSITYDRSFLGRAGRPVRPVPPRAGHGARVRPRGAGPGRLPPPSSIATETQADCFAGAWTRWVADGKAEHVPDPAPELDEVLRGYLLLRDPVGTSTRPRRRTAPTSTGCRPSRRASTTARPPAGTTSAPTGCSPRAVPTRPGLANQGNAPYARAGQHATRPSRSSGTARSPRSSASRSPAPDPAVRRHGPETCAPPGPRPRLLPDRPARRLRRAGPDPAGLRRAGRLRRGHRRSRSPTRWPPATSWACPPTTQEAVRSAVCLTGWFSARSSRGRSGRADLPGRPRRERAVPAHLRRRPHVLPRRRPHRVPAGRPVPQRLLRGRRACDVGA
jgi:hypothetical protein